MVQKIPFFAQQTEYTCGAASMRMLLAMAGIRRTEKELARDAKATKAAGIDAPRLATTLRRHGLPVVLTRRLRTTGLKDLLKKKVPVIVNYRMPGENIGHYGVAYGLSANGVIIADPTLGPRLTFSWKEFKGCWYGHRSPIKGAGRAFVPRTWQGREVL